MNIPNLTKTTVPTIVIVLTILILHVGAIPSLEEYNSIQNLKQTFNRTKQGQKNNSKTYVSDFDKFVNQTNSTIDSNKKKFTELRNYLEAENSTSKSNIEKIVDLENKNTKLKNELDEYVMTGNGNWKLISERFSKDLKKLDVIYYNALKLTADNIK